MSKRDGSEICAKNDTAARFFFYYVNIVFFLAIPIALIDYLVET